MDWLRGLDQASAEWFTQFRLGHPRLDQPMRDITGLGSQVVLSLVTIFAVGLLLCLRRRRSAAFLLAAALSGVLLSSGLKGLVGRERPPGADPLALAHGFSFPSGHSMLSAIIYLTLALIVTAVVHRRRVRVYVVGASLVIAGLIGVSRLYLGVHYLTDVVGSWAAGLVWALFCRWVESHWVLRIEGRERGAQAEAYAQTRT